MKTKLTLTIEQEILKKVKRYSRMKRKSISRLFEEQMESVVQKNIKSKIYKCDKLLKQLPHPKSKAINLLINKSIAEKHLI